MCFLSLYFLDTVLEICLNVIKMFFVLILNNGAGHPTFGNTAF